MPLGAAVGEGDIEAPLSDAAPEALGVEGEGEGVASRPEVGVDNKLLSPSYHVVLLPGWPARALP